MQLGDYFRLLDLARSRLRSEEDYRRFQAFQASLLLSYLRRFRVEVQHKKVLDLGSGVGGYSQELVTHGAWVVSLDLIQPSTQPKGDSYHPLIADALVIPICDRSVDVVFCASLIEHVSDPARLLSEIRRVLVPGGFCYLSFPPFFSPRGGHEFAPFHYFGERLAIRLTKQEKKHPVWIRELYGVSLAPQSFAETYPRWGLYKMTINKARRLIMAHKFDIINMSTRYLPISFVRWPIIGEVLTWHAQFILQKPKT